MGLPHGFKARAERLAEELRARVDADPARPLDLTAVAARRGVRVVSAADLVALERLQEIERIQAFSFSACTFDIDGHQIIVFNPIRSAARQASDVAHELAHIVLEHDLAEIQYLDGVPFRTCQPGQELEATEFGGTLLLPRKVLLREARGGATVGQVAKKFGVTTQMAQMRWNRTGVERQVANERARRSAKRK